MTDTALVDYGWAAFWSDGKPRPFILVHTTRNRRADVAEYMGKAWAKPGETPEQGWKRCYAKGCRIIRVKVTPR